MKKFYSIICFLLLPCFCLAQDQDGNANDYRFVTDHFPPIGLRITYPDLYSQIHLCLPYYPEDSKVFYTLGYDKDSGYAFIYNKYVCGYYNVPDSMKTGFKSGARKLKSWKPDKFQKRVREIKSVVHAETVIYVKVIDSLVERFASIDGEESRKVFDVVELMPSFRGGVAALMTYLNSSIKYPPEAEENGIQGRVVCSFIVERDGSITDVRVAKSVDPSLDKEAVRVVSAMPRWYPGVQYGRPVRVHYVLPVTFRLQ